MRLSISLALVSLLAFPCLVSAQVRTPQEQKADDRLYAISALPALKVRPSAWLEVYRLRPDLHTPELTQVVGTRDEHAFAIGLLDHTIRVLEGCG